MKVSLLLLINLFIVGSCFSQEKARIMTVGELFLLTDNQSKLLQIRAEDVRISSLDISSATAENLPDISLSVDASYLSNTTILRPNFSYLQTTSVPHFKNDFYFEASQTIYNGNFNQNKIKKARLNRELSEFELAEERQNLKILLLAKYLDLFRLFNAEIIYQKNIELAQRRLKDINSLRSQGMVTRNDRIRSDLQIEDFNLDLEVIRNNKIKINHDLCIILGLPKETVIIPDTNLYKKQTLVESVAFYKEAALTHQPTLQATKINEKIAEKEIEIQKSARYPKLSVYASNALQRPFLYTLTPINIYFNSYQAGVKLTYNISSLYRAKDNIDIARARADRQKLSSAYDEQQVEIEINTAFVNFKEAGQRYDDLTKSLEFANDNYRIVEKKYINQLALITDILDASTAKLSAELRLSNERINIINEYYKLQKSAGFTLDEENGK